MGVDLAFEIRLPFIRGLERYIERRSVPAFGPVTLSELPKQRQERNLAIGQRARLRVQVQNPRQKRGEERHKVDPFG